MQAAASLLLSALALSSGCSKGAAVSEDPGAAADVKTALSLAAQGADSREEKLLEAYRLVEKHPQGATLPLLVKELDGDDPRGAVHLLGMLSWEHPESAFEPLRRLLLEQGPPLREDPGGFVRVVNEVDRGFLRGEAAIALACLGDNASYDRFFQVLRSDPLPRARQPPRGRSVSSDDRRRSSR